MEHVTYMPREAKKEQEKLELLKTVLFGYNCLLFVLACLLLGISIWMAVDRNFMTYIIGNHLYAAAVFIVLACGAILFFISFAGCCGVVKEHKFLLFVYFIILCVIVVFLILSGILAIVFRTQIGDHVKGTMSDTLKESYGVGFESYTNRAITDAWDKAQERLMCCAVESNGWHLYRETKWFEQFGARDDDQMTYEDQDERPYVPQSCCVKDRLWRYVNRGVCQRWRLGPPGSPVDGAINRAVYYTGCFDAAVIYLKANAIVLIAHAIVIALLLVVGIVISGFIILSMRKNGSGKTRAR